MNLKIEHKHEKIDIEFKHDVSNFSDYERYKRAELVMRVATNEQKEIALKEYYKSDTFDIFEFNYEIFASKILFNNVINKTLFIEKCLQDFFSEDEEDCDITFYGRMCDAFFNMLSDEQKASVIERMIDVKWYDFHSYELDIINNSYYPSAILNSMTDEQISKLCNIPIYPIHNDIVYTSKMSFKIIDGKRKYFLDTTCNCNCGDVCKNY